MLFVIQKRLWWHRAFPIFFSLLFFRFYSFIQTIFVCRCDNRLCSVFMNLLMFFPQVFIASCCLVVFFLFAYTTAIWYCIQFTLCVHILLLTFFFCFQWSMSNSKQNKTKPIAKCEAYCQYVDLILFVWVSNLVFVVVLVVLLFFVCFFFCFLLQEVGMGEKALAISRLLFHPWHMHRIILYNTITLTVVLPKWLRKILLLGYICELNWNGVFILWKDLYDR